MALPAEGEALLVEELLLQGRLGRLGDRLRESIISHAR